MTKATFGSYIDYDETEKLARIYVSENDASPSIPLNVSLEDGSDVDLVEGESCEVSIWSNEYSDLGVYTPEECAEQGFGSVLPHKLIPSGTFPADPSKEREFTQNATIVFTAVVLEAEKTVDPEDDEPCYKLLLEAYGLTFSLLYFGHGPVEPGYVVDGTAWIYGKLKRA